MRKLNQPILNSILILALLFLLVSCFESSSSSDSSTETQTPPSPAQPGYTPIITGPQRTCSIFAQIGNCNDSIDNDGDGLVDWQEDLGCSGPLDNETVDCRENEDGWTTYDPHPSETVIIYVSSSLGNDTNNGLAPEVIGGDGPVKTVAQAISMLRNNSADWVLFRRGDVWTDESIDRGMENLSGLSPEYPIIVGAYSVIDDSTARPKFNFSVNPWYRNAGGTPTNISILGLDLNSYKFDPSNMNNFDPTTDVAGIGWVAGGGNFLLEDCKISYAQNNLQNNGSPTGYFELRRNVFTSAYSVVSHGQSLFTNISNPLLIEGNIMNHGGWNDDFRLVLLLPETNSATWAVVANGCFDIELESTVFQVSGVDFTGVANMNDVALVLQNAINNEILAATAQADTVAVTFSLGGVIKISSTDFLSDDKYSITASSAGGTDISGIGTSTFLNASVSGVPESTIFNRNMYLSHGLGNTALIGNIDANGASGGTQLRMGGLLDNNLFLENPISITVGHGQNDPYDVSGFIKNNVILGSRNIDTQLQGTGIDISSWEAANGYGPSYINNLKVYNNIVAHGSSVAQYNIKGITITGDGPHTDLDISGNIVYNWTNPSWSDPINHLAFGVVISDLDPRTTNSYFRNNIIQQTVSGFLVQTTSSAPPLTLSGNTYYSAETTPPTTGGLGWFFINGLNSVDYATWQADTGDTSIFPSPVAPHVFTDPTRNIASYHANIGGGASYAAFMTQALLQSRLNWDSRYTADAVNTWIRDGFDLVYEQ